MWALTFATIHTYTHTHTHTLLCFSCPKTTPKHAAFFSFLSKSLFQTPSKETTLLSLKYTHPLHTKRVNEGKAQCQHALMRSTYQRFSPSSPNTSLQKTSTPAFASPTHFTTHSPHTSGQPSSSNPFRNQNTYSLSHPSKRSHITNTLSEASASSIPSHHTISQLSRYLTGVTYLYAGLSTI